MSTTELKQRLIDRIALIDDEQVLAAKESRREWMLDIFKKAGEGNSHNSHYQFWQQDNHPIELFTAAFAEQKIDYIHNNPVTAGIVYKPEDYVYSSASEYYQGKNAGLLKIDMLL